MEELGIPLRRNYTSYMSIYNERMTERDDPEEIAGSVEMVETGVVEPDESDTDACTETIQVIKCESGDVFIDMKALLIYDRSSPSLDIFPSISPPDLLGLSAEDSLKAYSLYLRDSTARAQGPEVVSPLKSKSFTSRRESMEYNDDDEDEDTDMDKFDEKYEDKLRSFLESNNIQIDEQQQPRVRRSSSAERRVLFNGTKNVRWFSRESYEEEEEVEVKEGEEQDGEGGN